MKKQLEDTDESTTTTINSTSQEYIPRESPLFHRKEAMLGESHLFQLKRAMLGFCSNHILVNRERFRYGYDPLHRSPSLDDLARKQAAVLAEKQLLEPSTKPFLRVHLGAKAVGENILCGSDVQSMHRRIMYELPSHKRRILSRRYNEMGMGTAKSQNGQLYLVQYFRRNPEL
jgi:hypothetical protein